MLNSLADLTHLLAGTELENSNQVLLEIPESSECAFAIQVKPENWLLAWSTLRNLLDKTQRYPVLTGISSLESSEANHIKDGASWREDIVTQDLFAREWFTYERSDLTDVSSEAIVTRAKTVDIIQEIQRISQDETWTSIDDSDELDELIDCRLEDIHESFGIAPQKEAVLDAILNNPIKAELAFEKYLFDWEQEHFESDVLRSSNILCQG
jgi:hypothetical protein